MARKDWSSARTVEFERRLELDVTEFHPFQAMRWLEKAYEERAWSLLFLRRPVYDPLRSEPRFRELYRGRGSGP